jgi:D-3-phosphoglycerate dehydrogenase
MVETKEKFFIIDFDSTFTKVEALDILGEISLDKAPNRAEALKEIQAITDQGMDGSLDFRKSLEQRIEILKPHLNHLPELVDRLKKMVSKSFHRNIEFFKTYKNHIYIVSNGFKDFIDPIVAEYGVESDHVLANTFVFDEDGKVVDFDRNNHLSSNDGKVKTIKELNLDGEIYVIGDGYTDFEIKKAGLAHKFFAFTENVSRDQVLQNADHITPSLDEFLFVNKMNTVLSYPKNRIKVLVLENIHVRAFDLFRDEGYVIETYAGAMDEDQLCEAIKDVSIIGIRSKTNITARVLENANRLLAIGAFCIGTNQIDLEACQKKGVSVFNAPYSNTRSVVELAIAQIIMLMRNIPDKVSQMHAGKWNKSATLSNEVRNKKLGIVGYGNIGSQLSVLAEAIGMDVYYYDLLEKLAIGNATKCHSLDQLLSISDAVSLHVDGRTENKNLFGAREFDLMKDGSVLINLSRGHVIEIDALNKAIESGKIRGVGIDVFPEEPRTNDDEFTSSLRGLPNTILTPHIGGSTMEAQFNIASHVPSIIMEYINTGSTSNSVNFPQLKLPILEDAHRLMHIHHNVPGMLAKIDKILADHNINIVGQYLKTNDLIGYAITDINKKYSKQVIKDLKEIEGTIRVRVLY